MRRRPGREELSELGGEAVAVVFGIAFPAVFFVLSALGALEAATAFDVAKWSGLGLIVFYGSAPRGSPGGRGSARRSARWPPGRSAPS